MVRQTDTGSPDAVEHRRRGRRRHPAPRTVGVAFRHGTTTLDPVALPDEVIASLPPTNHASLPALQSWFVGTDLPGTLARRKIEVLVFAGVHVDWCIEGNVRAARDNGLLPIVIGDACGAQRPEQEAATFDRINRFFAPVITAEQFVDLVQR